MKKTKKILSKIGDVLFYVFVFFMVGVIGLSLYGKQKDTPVLPYTFMWVKSQSMEPEIEQKSFILVKKIDDVRDLEVGNYITFISRDKQTGIYGEYNTHEIVEIEGDYEKFWTKGINNSSRDSLPTYPEDIIYIYVGNLKVMTFFARVYSTPAGLTCTLVLIFAGIIIYLNIFLKNMKKEEKEEKMKELIAKEVEKLKQNNSN